MSKIYVLVEMTDKNGGWESRNIAASLDKEKIIKMIPEITPYSIQYGIQTFED
jgi:hypothetical protein